MVTAVLASLSLFAQAFAGTWTCYSQGYRVPWRIEAAPGDAWASVRWGDQTSDRGGIAYVGYVLQLKKWVYRDFHYDGTYSDITSPGPAGKAWTWSGPYYGNGRIWRGAVVWTLSSANRIDRTFESQTKGSLSPTGRDYCVRNAGAGHS